MLFVPARLIPLVGDDLSSVAESDLSRLIGLRETDDLDFKQAAYSKLEELADDVTAMANSSGGWIVLGVEENDEVATRLASFPIPAGEELRMRQSIAELVAPTPDVTMHEVHHDGEAGYLVIAIPPSPLAPHAVVKNKRLRYFERNGPSNRSLSESEIADRYRARFRRAEEQQTRLSLLREEGLGGLPFEEGETVWLAVALVPSRLGFRELNKALEAESRQWLQLRQQPFPHIAGVGTSLAVPPVGIRRVRISDDRCTAELHMDGAGFAAMWVGDGDRVASARSPHGPGEDTGLAVDEYTLTGQLVNALQLLGGSAVTLANTGGDADVTVELVGAPKLRAVLTSGWGIRGPIAKSKGIHSTRVVVQPHRALRSVLLEEIANVSSLLLRAAWPLLSDLVANFGLTEPTYITRDGELYAPSGSGLQRDEIDWAKGCGVPVVTERP